MRNMTLNVLVIYNNVVYDSSEPCQALEGSCHAAIIMSGNGR